MSSLSGSMVILLDQVVGGRLDFNDPYSVPVLHASDLAINDSLSQSLSSMLNTLALISLEEHYNNRNDARIRADAEAQSMMAAAKETRDAGNKAFAIAIIGAAVQTANSISSAVISSKSLYN